MIRRFLIFAAGLALAAGATLLPAAAASAYANPHPANHCYLWANPVVNTAHPVHCYANL